MANLGREKGMEVTRAVFAVMLKFADLTQDFVHITELIEMEVELLDDMSDAEQAVELIKLIKEDQHGEELIEKFERASDMRRWTQYYKLERSEKRTTELTKKLRKEKESEFKDWQAKQGPAKDKDEKDHVEYLKLRKE